MKFGENGDKQEKVHDRKCDLAHSGTRFWGHMLFIIVGSFTGGRITFDAI